MSALTSVQEYEAKAALLYQQAKDILTNPESTQEDANKIEAILADAKALKTKAFQLEEVGKAAAEFETKVDAKNKKPVKRSRWYPQAKGSNFSGEECLG